MLGAIAGDIIGSIYEFHNHRSEEFALFPHNTTFTDDSVLTIAVADVLLHGGHYADALKQYYQKYPGVSYGGGFRRWAMSTERRPYFSYGNGSAMRVSPVGWAFDTLEKTLEEARRSAEVTHNHPQGIKGAEAVAAVIFMGRIGASMYEIRRYIDETFRYDLNWTLEELRSSYEFDESCQGTVPQAITVLLASNSFEDAIRKAVSIGGDTDTVACIVGGMAEAFYRGVPHDIAAQVRRKLPPDLLLVVEEFRARFVKPQ